jgi:hypothetical protein
MGAKAKQLNEKCPQVFLTSSKIPLTRERPYYSHGIPDRQEAEKSLFLCKFLTTWAQVWVPKCKTALPEEKTPEAGCHHTDQKLPSRACIPGRLDFCSEPAPALSLKACCPFPNCLSSQPWISNVTGTTFPSPLLSSYLHLPQNTHDNATTAPSEPCLLAVLLGCTRTLGYLFHVL